MSSTVVSGRVSAVISTTSGSATAATSSAGSTAGACISAALSGFCCGCHRGGRSLGISSARFCVTACRRRSYRSLRGSVRLGNLSLDTLSGLIIYDRICFGSFTGLNSNRRCRNCNLGSLAGILQIDLCLILRGTTHTGSSLSLYLHSRNGRLTVCRYGNRCIGCLSCDTVYLGLTVSLDIHLGLSAGLRIATGCFSLHADRADG